MLYTNNYIKSIPDNARMSQLLDIQSKVTADFSKVYNSGDYETVLFNELYIAVHFIDGLLTFRETSRMEEWRRAVIARKTLCGYNKWCNNLFLEHYATSNKKD